jgi:hypothetical protein
MIGLALPEDLMARPQTAVALDLGAGGELRSKQPKEPTCARASRSARVDRARRPLEAGSNQLNILSESFNAESTPAADEEMPFNRLVLSCYQSIEQMQFKNVGFGMIADRYHILPIGGIGRGHYREIVSSPATLLKRMKDLFSIVCISVLALMPLSASPKAHFPKTHSPKTHKHASHPKVSKHKAHRSAHT